MKKPKLDCFEFCFLVTIEKKNLYKTKKWNPCCRTATPYKTELPRVTENAPHFAFTLTGKECF